MGLKSCTADCEGPISRIYNKLASTWLVLLLSQIVLRLHWISSLWFFSVISVWFFYCASLLISQWKLHTSRNWRNGVKSEEIVKELRRRGDDISRDNVRYWVSQCTRGLFGYEDGDSGETGVTFTAVYERMISWRKIYTLL